MRRLLPFPEAFGPQTKTTGLIEPSLLSHQPFSRSLREGGALRGPRVTARRVDFAFQSKKSMGQSPGFLQPPFFDVILSLTTMLRVKGFEPTRLR
jgi:hypothetical protein